MNSNLNNHILIQRVIKYLLEGAVVAVATYYIASRGHIDNKEITLIALTVQLCFFYWIYSTQLSCLKIKMCPRILNPIYQHSMKKRRLIHIFRIK